MTRFSTDYNDVDDNDNDNDDDECMFIFFSASLHYTNNSLCL